MSARWLWLVGIGDDGALPPTAQALVAQATLIVGGARHLELLGPTAAPQLRWPSPLTDALAAIVAKRGEPTLVLASGDPFFYGVGELLTKHIAAEEIFCLPHVSAFALVAARLCWSEQDCALLSLHGRPIERVIPHLQPKRRVIALSWDETTPLRVAELLSDRGFGESTVHVLENLGGERERIRRARAADFALSEASPLNSIGIDVVAGAQARCIPLTPGLADDWFEHDGQLTKRDVRAVTLAALAPRKGELLWDVGAGSGAVGIEWMLADPANRAIAIEADAARAARIARNAANLGAPGLEILAARAPQALEGLAEPDAVFVGGGANAELLDRVWTALPRFGRVVVNAVTLETQTLLAEMMARRGGELTQIQIARSRMIGRFHALEPAMPVLQWRAIKI